MWKARKRRAARGDESLHRLAKDDDLTTPIDPPFTPFDSRRKPKLSLLHLHITLAAKDTLQCPNLLSFNIISISLDFSVRKIKETQRYNVLEISRRLKRFQQREKLCFCDLTKLRGLKVILIPCFSAASPPFFLGRGICLFASGAVH